MSLNSTSIILPRPSIAAQSPSPSTPRTSAASPPPTLSPLPLVDITHPQLATLAHSLHRLTPPAHFAQPSWQTSTAYPDLVAWRTADAPQLIHSVHRQLAHLDTHALLAHQQHQLQLHALLYTAILTLARFVPPTRQLVALAHPSDDFACVKASRQEYPPWSTQASSDPATAALDLASSLATPSLSPSRLAVSLLDLYIRPLYAQSSRTGPIDPATGRQRPPAPGASHLVAPGMGVHEPLDDAPAWKGGSAASLVSTLPPPLQSRDTALGNENVLCYAIVLLRRSAANGEPAWTETWYRLVPPLVALLQDHEVRYRLAASRTVEVLLAPSTHGGIPASLLETTGVWSLFESALSANLRFTTHSIGAQLLDSATGALRSLILLLLPPGAASEDEDEERSAALHRLLSEAVLHVWSYTSTPSSQRGRDVRLMRTTARWLATLSLDLGVGVRRVVETCIEVLLLSWLGSVDASLFSYSSPTDGKADDEDEDEKGERVQRQELLDTIVVVISALSAVLDQARGGPQGKGRGIRAVETRREAIVVALARFWTRTRPFVVVVEVEVVDEQAPRPRRSAASLEGVHPALIDLVAALKRSDAGMDAVFERVSTIDPSIFDPVFL